MKKFELAEETKIERGLKTLYRIRALIDFDTINGEVKAGDLGGYVESEKNLSQDGSCWIFDDATVSENAMVRGKAIVRGSSVVCGEAIVCGESEVCDFAVVCGNSTVSGHAKVSGNAFARGNSKITGYAIIM